MKPFRRESTLEDRAPPLQLHLNQSWCEPEGRTPRTGCLQREPYGRASGGSEAPWKDR